LANNSLIAGQIKSQSALVDFKSKYLESISQRMARALIVPSESSTQMRLELPKNISSSSSKELSDQIFDLTNQARADKSLPAYVRDDRLDQLANLYAVQIIATGNFSHRDQNGLLPDQRAKDYGITFDYIGENLAFAPSILSAQTGLMASTGHRANIESPVFRKMGVAVVEIQYFGDIVVEEFTN
jgi:uncharacterized protein YkwD